MKCGGCAASPETMVFGARDEEVWSWRYQDQNPMFFNVLFDRDRRDGQDDPAAREILFLDQNM